MPIIHGDPDFLAHYGVLGQKWGIRRFQNKDGTLTAAGKEHYKTESKAGNVFRALNYSPTSQRIWGVGANRGRMKDTKEMKATQKARRQKIKTDNSLTEEERNNQLQTLKKDTKETIKEINRATADAIYPWQQGAVNERIHGGKISKVIATDMLLGSYGGLRYHELRASGESKGRSALAGISMNLLSVPFPKVARGLDTAAPIVYYIAQKSDYNKRRSKTNSDE